MTHSLFCIDRTVGVPSSCMPAAFEAADAADVGWTELPFTRCKLRAIKSFCSSHFELDYTFNLRRILS